MNYAGQQYEEKDVKLKKVIKISIILALIALFIVLGVYMYVYYLELQNLRLSVDSQRTAITEQTFIIDETTGTVYVAIDEFAKIVGYEFYQGEYGKYTETKKYIEEVAKDKLGLVYQTKMK